MKLFPTFLFVLLVFTVSAQQQRNEISTTVDSKEALETVKKNKQIRNKARRRPSDARARQQAERKSLNRKALTYNYNQVRKEQELFTHLKGQYSKVLIDLKGYKAHKKDKLITIKAGETITILKKKRKKFKIKYAGDELVVDRQFYLAKKEKTKN